MKVKGKVTFFFFWGGGCFAIETDSVCCVKSELSARLTAMDRAVLVKITFLKYLVWSVSPRFLRWTLYREGKIKFILQWNLICFNDTSKMVEYAVQEQTKSVSRFFINSCEVDKCKQYFVKNYSNHCLAWSTKVLNTYGSQITREYNWQIINMPLTPFYHWLAECI